MPTSPIWSCHNADSPNIDVMSDFAQSIAEAARTLNKPHSLNDTLQTIVEVAHNSVTGFDHVGIATLENKGDIDARASTRDLVAPLDMVQ